PALPAWSAPHRGPSRLRGRVSQPLSSCLAGHAVTGPGHGAQPGQRDCSAASLADSESSCLQASLRRPDLVQLVALATLQTRQEILRSITTSAFDQAPRLLCGQRGKLLVRRRHRAKQPVLRLVEQRTELSRPVHLHTRPLDCHESLQSAAVSKKPARRAFASITACRRDSIETAQATDALLGLDGNRRTLGCRRLGQGHGEQPVLEGRGHLGPVHRHWQANGTCETPVASLHPVVALLLLFLLLVLLALHRHELLLERDLDVLGIHPRDLRLHHAGLLRLGHVHAGRPLSSRRELVELHVAETLEEPLHLLPEAGHSCPRHQRSHLRPPFSPYGGALSIEARPVSPSEKHPGCQCHLVAIPDTWPHVVPF